MPDFETIVAAHADAVWRTVYRLLDDYEDARDCYQETFLAALRLPYASTVQHWRTLLVRIATRRALDRLRARYRTAGLVDGSHVVDQLAVADHAVVTDDGRRKAPARPEAAIEAAELRQQVRAALASLPAQQAEAFWLRHLENQEIAEVAQSLDIEPGHARVLVHRAAAALSVILGPHYGPATLTENNS